MRPVGLRDAQFGGVRAGPATRAADGEDLPASRAPDAGDDLLAGDAGGAEHAPTDGFHVHSFSRSPVRVSGGVSNPDRTAELPVSGRVTRDVVTDAGAVA